MMKKYIKTAGFAALILLSVQVFGYQILRTYSDGGVMNSWDFMRKFFLYADGVQKISFISCLSYFTVLVLSLFSFLSGSVSYLRSYRSLVLHRYRRKLLFLKHIIRSDYISTAAVTIWLALCVFAVPAVHDMQYVSSKDMQMVLLLFVNLFLYFNICVLLKVYLTFRINEVYAMTLIGFFTVILLYLDTKVTQISILTLGNLRDTLCGLLVLMLTYGLLTLKLVHFIRRKDIL